MGCSSCGSGSNGLPKGCRNNGGCSTGGCNKLNVYDWLEGIAAPSAVPEFDVVEVRFKGSRKEFYRNINRLELYTGDAVMVQSEGGMDMGHVSLRGELVRLQMKKAPFPIQLESLPAIYRKAHEKDLERYEDLKMKEPEVLEKARTIAMELGLSMKISDNEVQGDGKKVFFYYTAESRVDFRELIKRYAEAFGMRVEMRQIGYRQEAARLGGIGSCGRVLCCSTWLTDFKVVGTSAARYQNLSINMQKLSGQCGRLKCCLNYELDTYMEAVSDIPKGNVSIDTALGKATLQKTDILKRMMWFAYEGKSDWIPVKVERVNHLLDENRRGIIPEKLETEVLPLVKSNRLLEVEDLLVDNNINRMDQKKKQAQKPGRDGKKRRPPRKPRNNG